MKSIVFGILLFFVSSASFATEIVEGTQLTGTVVGLGGESDVYFMNDAQLGTVYLENKQGDISVYEAIREFAGEDVVVTGWWDESQDETLVFIVDKIEVVVLPVEGTKLTGTVVGLGGESDVYFMNDAQLGTVYLENKQGDISVYEAIREFAGEDVVVTGWWDESQDETLVFIVDKIEVVVLPVEGTK